MKDKTLLILAAGLGSRFGGLKQIEPVGPNGEFIIDYSIYDALRNGFNKIIIIIKEENYNTFRETIGKRIENKVKVEYVFQDMNDTPIKNNTLSNRTKPIGTAHAIYAARKVINEPFMIINADDFYGNEAYKAASEYLDSNNDLYEIGLICYDVINTITENGSVKRGICNIKDNYLLNIDESIVIKNNNIEATSIETGKKSILNKDTKVSMNMMMFYPNIIKYIEKDFKYFINNKNLSTDEFLIVDVVSRCINRKDYKVKAIYTNAKWSGVTYKEDKEYVTKFIKNQIKESIYPNNLWN